MSAKSHESHGPNVKLYLVVFGSPMVLTFLTVAISHVQLPHPWNIVVGLIIATVKASLVAAFFMHLKGEHKFIYWVLGVTFATAAIFVLPIIDSVATANRRLAEPVPAEAEHAHVP